MDNKGKRITKVSIGKKPRSCGSCTKCCQGYLSGEAHGKPFYNGRPCFYCAENGCSIYEDRPKDPCQSYTCLWLIDDKIPEWLKPELVNAIISHKEIKGIPYIELVEAGATMSSKVLSWFFQFGLDNKLNLLWQVEGGHNWIGSAEFLGAMKK